MPERCCAIWPAGERCDGLAVVDDPALAGYVCYKHAPAGPRQQEAIRTTIRRAISRPDRYLAAALAEWLDEDLAGELGCSRTVVWRLRLMGWPGVDRFDADVALMADALGADRSRLAALIRSLVGAYR
jgi:hypothetical protein